MCVFLSLYYLEDHSDSLSCRGRENKDDTESYKALLESNPPSRLDGEDPGSIEDMLGENHELKKTMNRLANIGPRGLPDRSGHLDSLKERMLKYMQDVNAENVQLKRTIQELANSLNEMPGKPPVGIWQERSLKYLTAESLGKVLGKSTYPARETAAIRDTTVLSCKEISQIEIKEELGRGYTKLTERGVYNGCDVAVKSVGLDSTDLHNCVKEKRAKVVADCLLFSRYKIMKELLLYQQLHHPNIVKVGYSVCCMQVKFMT